MPTGETTSSTSTVVASTNCFEGFPQFEVRGTQEDCLDPQRLIELIGDQLDVTVPARTFLLLLCVTSLPATASDLAAPCRDLALEFGAADTGAQDAALCHQGASTFLAFSVADDNIDPALQRLQADRLIASFDAATADQAALDDEAEALRRGERITEPLETIDRYLAACTIA